MKTTPARRVSAVERSDRILIHSLRSTLAGVTGPTVRKSESSDVLAGPAVRVLMTRS